MALPPLAEVDDLAAWVGQDIPDGDPRAEAVLSAASALVRSYAGQTWVAEPGALSDVPDVVAAVVVQVAARVWLNPAGLESVTLDDGTRRWGSQAGAGIVLTEADKAALTAHRASGSTGIGSVSLTGGSYVRDTIYVPTAPEPSGPPFPWYAADDPAVQ